ncbi:hypothetical protein [Pseudomonas sp. 24 E 13]|uniref:hypothetical protein n=1 Tax=Pseudomonas sp. 24 E 13 TaxID=1844095 RepID=UPI000811D427|nr:hypothetical protein [Pseudomonas sp. 24 E 13]CRM04773.1 hypothetical protein [Pseudomonas sp. 24 E 13]
MKAPIYSLRLANASDRDWTFFVYQAAVTKDERIASLVWIASPSLVPAGSHALLMWHAEPSFIWSTHSQHPSPMPFTASGQCVVDLGVDHGVLFNLDNNAPSFESCTRAVAPGPWTIAVEDNVPDHTYLIGTCMDGAGTLVSTAMTSRQYDFTPAYCIAAANHVGAASVVDHSRHHPTLRVHFPADVYALSFYLDEHHHWHPGAKSGISPPCIDRYRSAQ